MTIPSVSLDSTYQSGQVSPWRKDFKLLAASLKSADIRGAQSALKSFQKDLPEALKSQASQDGSPLNTSLNSLSTALQSNNLAHAQDAFANLRLLLRYGAQSGAADAYGDAVNSPSTAPADAQTNPAAIQNDSPWLGRRINTSA